MLWFHVIIALICVSSSQAALRTTTKPPPLKNCTSCVRVGTSCYNVTYLFEIEAPFRTQIVISKIGIWRSRNFLLYAFEPNITDPEYSKVGYVNLDNPSVTQILSNGKQSNFRTFDVDQDNNVVYLGGGDAVWVLDGNNKPIFYSSKGDTITNIFFKNNVFFVREGELQIVEKKDEFFKPYDNYHKIKNFVINKYNILVYLNTSGLYANRFPTTETVYLSNNPFFRGLTVDLEGVIYAWWLDGIYKVLLDPVLENSRIERIADIPDIGALTFDNENQFLFTSGKSLFRLVNTGLFTNTTAC